MKKKNIKLDFSCIYCLKNIISFLKQTFDIKEEYDQRINLLFINII